MKRRYRVGLTIQELEAQDWRAEEAQRRNSFLVYRSFSHRWGRSFVNGLRGGLRAAGLGARLTALAMRERGAR